MSLQLEDLVKCRLCKVTVEGSDLCPVCGYCKACSAGMPETGACFNCVEVHRLVVEFLGALEEWDLERYGPGAATALRELKAISDRIDEHY